MINLLYCNHRWNTKAPSLLIMHCGISENAIIIISMNRNLLFYILSNCSHLNHACMDVCVCVCVHPTFSHSKVLTHAHFYRAC